MTNEQRGIAALNTYYREAALQLQGYTPASLEAYYRGRWPDFLDWYGSALKYASAEDLAESLRRLGTETQRTGQLAHRDDFFDSLSGQVLRFTLSDSIDVLKETGRDVANVAKVGLSGVGIYLAALGVFAVLMLARRKA